MSNIEANDTFVDVEDSTMYAVKSVDGDTAELVEINQYEVDLEEVEAINDKESTIDPKQIHDTVMEMVGSYIKTKAIADGNIEKLLEESEDDDGEMGAFQ